MVFTTHIRIIPVLFAFIFLTACTGDTPEPFPSPAPAQADEVTQPEPVADPVADPEDDVHPSIPMSLRAIGATSSQVSFAWNASSDNVAVTGYRLYKNGSATHFTSTAALSFTDTGLTANQTYQYRVTAMDGAGNESNMSASLTVNTLAEVDSSAPTTPSNLRASNVSSDQISIAWNASSDNVAVTGYRLYKNGSATHFASTASLSFNDTGLVSGQTYQYRVTAIDEAGNESVMSSVLTITTLVVVDPQPANLSWTSPTRNSDESCLSGIDGYRVSFGSAPGNYTQTVELSLSGGEVLCTQSDFDAVCNEPIMSCSYSTTPLTAGAWYFVVQAQDQSGVYSMYSNEVSKIIE